MLVLALFLMFSAAAEDRKADAGRNRDRESAVHTADSLFVMFWNLENFFDWKDGGGGESDRDFTPEGVRHWTSSRFYVKCRNISKALLWIASENGSLPDVVGLAEVENRNVLSELLNATALRKTAFSLIHYDSPDHRGIDVALLYRKDRFERLSSRPISIPGQQTRDILAVRLRSRLSGEEYNFLVCHLPSKYGGAASIPKRFAAAARLRSAVDSLSAAGQEKIIVMGDFNDVPSSAAFDTLRPVLQVWGPEFEGRGEGSIKYDGRWEMIDLFWTSGQMKAEMEMSVVRLPFLMARDNVFSGEKPLRTYVGPHYTGGVSDHCPVLLKIVKIE